jgi:hypothetical protein
MNPVPVGVWTMPSRISFYGSPACRIAVGTSKYANLRRLGVRGWHSPAFGDYLLGLVALRAQAGLNWLSALDGVHTNSAVRATSATQ